MFCHFSYSVMCDFYSSFPLFTTRVPVEGTAASTTHTAFLPPRESGLLFSPIWGRINVRSGINKSRGFHTRHKAITWPFQSHGLNQMDQLRMNLVDLERALHIRRMRTNGVNSTNSWSSRQRALKLL